MKILFLCTAHNSLSQRLFLDLSKRHSVTIEYALSDEIMIEAVDLAKPNIVICPFLTRKVPERVYKSVRTLIIHPGPPGDAGPSALDWLILGDTGAEKGPHQLLQQLDTPDCAPGRTSWGVTILEATESFDAGPVWAFELFSVDIDKPGLTKSSLYRGEVTRAAIIATEAALERIQNCVDGLIDPRYGVLSVGHSVPYQGGKVHYRPLLKAAALAIDVNRHTAQRISRRLRCSDSQPGALSNIFKVKLYLYGGMLETPSSDDVPKTIPSTLTKVLAIRHDAVCVFAADGKGVWITHIRRPKSPVDQSMFPKVPAVPGLVKLGVLDHVMLQELDSPPPLDWSKSEVNAYQDIWIDFQYHRKTAFLYFDFYNGAMGANQCYRLLKAMQYIIDQSATKSIRAVVLMGSSYFSNGIALNVIEASDNPAKETWSNIQHINNVVLFLLREFPRCEILTIAAVRGNAAAGGVALATACDYVIAGSEVVLNPAYGAVGLFGSEYHTLTYSKRCGENECRLFLESMTPMSALKAREIGLVDFVFPGSGTLLDDSVHSHIDLLLEDGSYRPGAWKRGGNGSALADNSLDKVLVYELRMMGQSVWGSDAAEYSRRRHDFVRKVRPSHTPWQYATHRAPRTTEEVKGQTSLYDEKLTFPCHYGALEGRQLEGKEVVTVE